MRQRFSSLVYLAVLIVGLGLFFSGQTRAETAPDWSLTDVDGKAIKLSDFKGKIVILNFWATWCPPCRAEIPDFIDLQKQYQGKGVEIVGLSVDSDPPAKVAAFAKKNGINYPIAMSTEDLAQQYGVTEGIPVTCIIAPDGTIADKHLGMVDKDYLEGWVKKLLPSVATH
jgi:peroxiredoxin